MLKTKLRELIPLQHIAWCNLINPDARLQFLRDLIACRLVSFRWECVSMVFTAGWREYSYSYEDMEVLHPPLEEALDSREEAKWREDFAKDYVL